MIDMNTLHRITGRAKKCGPSAFSAVTGISTHDAAAIMRRVTGRTAINGLWSHEMCAALRDAGYRYTYRFHERPRKFERPPLPTLKRWLAIAEPGVYVICSKRHWIAVAINRDENKRVSGEWADSAVRKPQSIGFAPMRMRVEYAIRVIS